MVIGLILLLVGVVWIAQGVGVLHGSPMTGEAIWAVLGAPLVLIGALVVRNAARAQSQAPD